MVNCSQNWQHKSLARLVFIISCAHNLISGPPTFFKRRDGRQKAGFPKQPRTAAVPDSRGTSHGQAAGSGLLRQRGGAGDEWTGLRRQAATRCAPAAGQRRRGEHRAQIHRGVPGDAN